VNHPFHRCFNLRNGSFNVALDIKIILGTLPAYILAIRSCGRWGRCRLAIILVCGRGPDSESI
jgi:hypothetical protein